MAGHTGGPLLLLRQGRGILLVWFRTWLVACIRLFAFIDREGFCLVHRRLLLLVLTAPFFSRGAGLSRGILLRVFVHGSLTDLLPRVRLQGGRVDRVVSDGLGGAMQWKRRLAHARGYLELDMVAEAAAELSFIPLPENETTEVIVVRLAVLQEQKNWPALSALAGGFVRRSPDNAAAWVTWAYATRRADSLAAAEKILLEAEHHHPSEPTIQFNLGCYACQRGDLVAAQSRVDRAISLDAKFAEAAATDPDLASLRRENRRAK